MFIKVIGNSSQSNWFSRNEQSFDKSRVFNRVTHFVQFASFHPSLIHLLLIHLCFFVFLTHDLSLFLSIHLLLSDNVHLSVHLSIHLTVAVSGFWCSSYLSHCSVYNIFISFSEFSTSVIQLLVLHWFVKLISVKEFYYINGCTRHLSSFSSQYHFSLCTQKSVCLLILIFKVDA